jgi:hypothetical protein
MRIEEKKLECSLRAGKITKGHYIKLARNKQLYLERICMEKITAAGSSIHTS